MPNSQTHSDREGGSSQGDVRAVRSAPLTAAGEKSDAFGGRPGSVHEGRGHPRSTARIFGHPIHPMLIPFPIAFFIGAFVTDIVYWQTENLMWQYFSIWLLTGGLIMGALAALTGFIDYFGDRRVRKLRPATPHMLLNIVVMLLALVNAFVHSRDGWTAVVPQGLILSAVTTVILGISAWLGGSLSYRHAVGVAE